MTKVETASRGKVTESLRVLLSEVVDYAGLFPPSQLTMDAAVQNYADYLHGDHSWMLGRFICPVARLDEFADAASLLTGGGIVWRISALAGNDLAADMRKIAEFNHANTDRAVIDAVEIKVTETDQIKAAKRVLPETLAAYFEIPPNVMYFNEMISAVALNRFRGKIRTGGVTPDAFPPVDEIVKFMRVCIAANVPFKATAGLHHPLRCMKPLTYEPDAPVGPMHGFLNVFLAAAFLRQNLNAGFVNSLMSDNNSANFKFTDDQIEWNNQRISVNDLQLSRLRNAISFGSCSFLEPIEDLQQIGLL